MSRTVDYINCFKNESLDVQQVTKAKPKEGLWKEVDEKLTKEA